jgi:hypothetical protein
MSDKVRKGVNMNSKNGPENEPKGNLSGNGCESRKMVRTVGRYDGVTGDSRESITETRPELVKTEFENKLIEASDVQLRLNRVRGKIKLSLCH